MQEIMFEWDNNKAISNYKKHGVTFEEARLVFYDKEAMVFRDDEHSLDEERFIILGSVECRGILVVIHCYRHEDTIRIISARKATKKEQSYYLDNL